jgi:hypothetical protein
MDTVYRPISDTDTESETPSPQTELPIQCWSDFRKELEDQAGVDHDDLTPEDAATQIRERRQESPTPENASARPIVRHVTSDKPVSLREATDDLFYTRGLEERARLLAQGHTEAEVAQLGVDKMEAANRGDPLDPPPIEVKPRDEFGEADKPLTVEEASRRLTDWRAEQEAQRQAELATLVGEREARQQQEAEAQQPEPEQPQQPDPVQEERERLAQERWRIAQLRQMDGHEVAARMEYDQTVRAVLAEFPGLQTAQPTPQHIEELRQKDPARFQRLAQYDTALRQHQQRIAAMAQQRGVHEQQQAQINAQQRAAARAPANGDAERVTDLQKQLRGAKGNRAIKLGVELMRARRSLNGA